MRTTATTYNNHEIQEFLEIFEKSEGNIRFRFLHVKDGEIPSEKYITLNINQIDDEARERLLEEFGRRRGFLARKD